MKKILFILNHTSGTGKHKKFPEILAERTDLNFQYQIQGTNAPQHATQIARSKHAEFDAVVIVGGDGSINETADALIGTNTPLGIIPMGSGNGLARFLKIPLSINKALDVIQTFHTTRIDTMTANNKSFVNVAGIGFDAHISHKFAQIPGRGLKNYAKLVAREFKHFRPQPLEIIADGHHYTKELFLLSVANSSQFGNNAHIAPGASVHDGLMDVVFLRKFPLVHAPALAAALFAKKINQSKYFESLQAKELIIRSTAAEVKGHVDGEPITLAKETRFRINPLSLNIIVP